MGARLEGERAEAAHVNRSRVAQLLREHARIASELADEIEGKPPTPEPDAAALAQKVLDDRAEQIDGYERRKRAITDVDKQRARKALRRLGVPV